MQYKSSSNVSVATVISLIGAAVGVLGGSAAVAQEGGCTVIESDPPTWPDPSQFPPLPAQCSAPGVNDCTDDGCIIDVLVVYTALAREVVGGVNAINDRIDQAVLRMNEAFVNSQIQSFVRLVGTAEVDYADVAGRVVEQGLACLKNPSCMPLAHVLRNELKADLVSLFVVHTDGTAIGATDLRGPFSALNVLYAARDSSWLFAHEAGHDLCAGHQLGVQGGGCASYCHAYFYNGGPSASFATIMRNVVDRNIQHYSNPYVSYLGVPTGIANSADNARCIRTYAPTIAFNHKVSDCNGNGICDAHDIAVGTSQDCDRNGIPDECSYSLNGYPGRCCLDGTCTYKTELCCLYQGGMFGGYSCGEDCNLNEVDDACEFPGACCTGAGPDGCSVIPEDCCIALAGTFRGAGTRCGADCNNNAIPDGCGAQSLGACCFQGMLCEVMLPSCCTGRGGTFGGAGTYCEDCNRNGWPAPCEGPTTQEYGACCNLDGGCIIATECSCQGSFLGVGTTCGLPPGACCTGTTCTVAAQTCCISQGGAFIGVGSTCDDGNGNGVPDVCDPDCYGEDDLHPCCLPPAGPCVRWTEECCSAVGGQFFPTVNKCIHVTCDFLPYGPTPEP